MLINDERTSVLNVLTTKIISVRMKKINESILRKN